MTKTIALVVVLWLFAAYMLYRFVRIGTYSSAVLNDDANPLCDVEPESIAEPGGGVGLCSIYGNLYCGRCQFCYEEAEGILAAFSRGNYKTDSESVNKIVAIATMILHFRNQDIEKYRENLRHFDP